MRSRFLVTVLLGTFFGGGMALAQDMNNVVEDQGVGLSRAELEYVVRNWSPALQKAAADDEGERFELLSTELSNKKMAAEADKIGPDANPDAYWLYVFTVRAAKRRLVMQNFMSTLDVPDMNALAKERYLTEKDKYALVPEERLSSHILIQCLPGMCSRDEKRPLAEEVLEKLKAGADFGELVQQYSDDRGTKAIGGRFDQWIKRGEPHVVREYVNGLFGIDKVGGYSGVVESRFGFHVIRLDDRHEQYYKSFDEVQEAIVAELTQEYRKLAATEFERRYRFSDEVVIDHVAMEEIFAPYKTTTDTLSPDSGEASIRGEAATVTE